jgi:hypothetical protein
MSFRNTKYGVRCFQITGYKILEKSKCIFISIVSKSFIGVCNKEYNLTTAASQKEQNTLSSWEQGHPASIVTNVRAGWPEFHSWHG